MRRILAFFIVFSVFSTAFADNIDGFYKMKFGMSEDQVKTIAHNYNFNAINKSIISDDLVYIEFMPFEKFSFFDNEIYGMTCYFCDGYLVNISLMFIDIKDHQAMRDNIFNKFPYLEYFSGKDFSMKFKDTGSKNYLEVIILPQNDHVVFGLNFEENIAFTARRSFENQNNSNQSE